MRRDLKCENLLMGADDSVKVGDFGFAVKKIEDNELQTTRCGSYAYTAPEILKRSEYDGMKADIWSM